MDGLSEKAFAERNAVRMVEYEVTMVAPAVFTFHVMASSSTEAEKEAIDRLKTKYLPDLAYEVKPDNAAKPTVSYVRRI